MNVLKMSLGNTKESEWQHDYSNVEIHHTTVIHPDTIIGKGVKIGAHSVIGFDGFNYPRNEDNVPVLPKHTKPVIIEDNVEIHSNTCIDRGLYRPTRLGKDAKVDNLVHIAHDVDIDERSLIVAGTVISGEVTIGHDSFLGVNVSVKPKLKIGNYSMLGIASNLLEDVPDNEIWAGNPARKIRNNEFFKGV